MNVGDDADFHHDFPSLSRAPFPCAISSHLGRNINPSIEREGRGRIARGVRRRSLPGVFLIRDLNLWCHSAPPVIVDQGRATRMAIADTVWGRISRLIGLRAGRTGFEPAPPPRDDIRERAGCSVLLAIRRWLAPAARGARGARLGSLGGDAHFALPGDCSRLARNVAFTLEAGPSDAIRFPKSGPMMSGSAMPACRIFCRHCRNTISRSTARRAGRRG